MEVQAQISAGKKRNIQNVFLGDSNQVINASLATTKRLRSAAVSDVPCQICGKMSKSSTIARVLHNPDPNLTGTEILKNNGVGVHRSGVVVCEACKKFSSRFAARLSANKSSPECDEWLTKCGCRRMGGSDSFTSMIEQSLSDICRWCRFRRCHSLGLVVDNDIKAALKGPIDLHEVPCAVCAAPSSGYHFGVITCEGCKGFFRRTIHHQLENTYVCESNGTEQCDVTTQTGRRCKRCRFSKCTALGMSLAAIRTGRHSYQLRAETMSHLAQLHSSQAGTSTCDVTPPSSVPSPSYKMSPATAVSAKIEPDQLMTFPLSNEVAENSVDVNPYDASPSEAYLNSIHSPVSDSAGPVHKRFRPEEPFANSPDSKCMVSCCQSPALDSSGNSSSGSESVHEAIARMKTPCEKSPYIWLYDSGTEYLDLRDPYARPNHNNSISMVDKDPFHILENYFFATPVENIISSQLSMPDATRAQWIIRKVVQSSRLIGNIAGVRSVVRPDMTPTEVFTVMTGHFDSFSRFALQFVKSLPGFDSVCLEDRTKLFVESMFPLLSAQLSLDYDEVSQTSNICGLQPGPGRQLAFNYFYHLGLAEPPLRDAGISMKQAKLCVIEFSMVCGLLFFNPDVNGLVEPQKVKRIYGEYKRAAEIFIGRNFRMNGSNSASDRIKMFYTQLSYFRSFYPFFSWLLCDFGENFPEYVGMDAWMTELYDRVSKLRQDSPPSMSSPVM